MIQLCPFCVQQKRHAHIKDGRVLIINAYRKIEAIYPVQPDTAHEVHIDDEMIWGEN